MSATASARPGPASTGDESVSSVVQENIDALLETRRRFEAGKSLQDRLADLITRFAGSMLFVWLHVAWFGLWIAYNAWPGAKPFDDFPFGLLTMIVSLEAIFLSTFVLLSQNRMSVLGERRNDLDLQIDLLSEREVTHILETVDAIAEKLGVEVPGGEAKGLKERTSASEVIDEIERSEEADHGKGRPK